MNRTRTNPWLAAACTLLVLAVGWMPALADGTETLGPTPIATGTRLVSVGVGLNTQPQMVSLPVPAGVGVEQAYIYWNGFFNPGFDDDTIRINGIQITGTRIGGPTLFFAVGPDQTFSSTYRADITSFILSGSNNLLFLDGLEYDTGPGANDIANGASILAVLNEPGEAPHEIQLVDGQDLAFLFFAPPLDTTVPQAFTITPSPIDRAAEITVIAGSVEGPVSGIDPIRPNMFRVTYGPGGTVDSFVDLFVSNVGNEWDHHVLDVTVPAGTTSITIQALSFDDGSSNLPASMNWLAGAIDLPPGNPDIDIEKLTNGNQADGANDADVPLIAPGDAVTWTYIVTNTGDVAFPFADVAVADSQLGLALVFNAASDAGGDGILSPGEVWVYTAQGVAADLDGIVPPGTAVVPGCNPSGDPDPGDRETYENLGTVAVPGASDLDPSHYCNPNVPRIDIEKLTNGNQADASNGVDVPQVAPGAPIVWTYQVTNTGDVTFAAADVVVTDSQGLTLNFDVSSDDGADGLLSPAEVWIYTAQGVALDLDGPVPPGTVIVPGCNPGGGPVPGARETYENIGTVVVPGDTDLDPSHYCNPPTPGIDIEKLTNGNQADGANDADVPQLAPGGAVTWTYEVTNTGDIAFAFADVTVTDSQLGPVLSLDPASDAGADGVLSPGEVWIYTAQGVALDLDGVVPPGTVIVPGCNPGGGAVPGDIETYENIGSVVVPGDTDADPSHYCNPPAPGIDIEKLTNGNDADGANDGDVPQIDVGAAVTWTYEVTNTGDVPFAAADVVVTDSQGLTLVFDPASDDGADGILSAGEVWIYTAQGVALDLDGTVPAGTVIVPGCNPAGGPVPGDRETYENIGTVVVPGDTDEDPSHYCNTPNPGIDIEKTTNGNDADGANDGDVPQVAPGDAVTWTYEVTNTGDVPFAAADVTVADSQGLALIFDPASDDGADGILSVGEVWIYTAQGVALDLDGTVPAGTVIVPGCNPGGTPVPGDRETYENIGTVTVPGDTDEDPSHYCNPPAPGIDIEKLTNGNDADGANDGDVPQIDVGAAVTWTYEVTNTGDVPFAAADVVVTDSQGLTLVFDPASDDGADGILSVGEVWIYTAQGVALDLDGTVPAGTVIVPGCNPAGGPVPGDRETYENIGTVVVPGDTDEDPSHYCNTPNPGIDIEKLTNGNQADGANDGDVPQLNPGDAITWTYEVTNTGDVPFAQADVTVADSQGLTLVFDPASDDGVDGILSVGEVWVYTAQGVALDLDGTVPAGTVIVPGCNPNGTPVPGDRETYENIGTVTVPGDTDEDPSHYCNPPAPGIDIEKLTNGNQADGANDGDVPQIDVGAPVTWTYEVTNTGDVPFAAADVVVTDSQGLTLVFDPASDDGADGILSVGEVWTYTAQGVALDLDGTVPAGTVIVPGCNPAGGPVPGDRETYENIGTVVVPGDTDEDPSHYCNTPNPGIDIEKLTNGNQADGANDGDVPQLNPGDAITWTYEVTNTGDVPFAQADVTVADSQGLTLVFDPASDDGVDGILSVGEVWVYTAQGVALDLDGTVPAGTVIVPGCNPNGTPVPGDRETYENIGTVTVPGDTDEDPSHYCNPPAPGIDIEKLTNGNQADGANDGDVPQIDVGAPVTWTYEVTNTGDVPFAAADVVVTDSQGLTLVFDPASDDGADGILSVGEVWIYTAQGVALDLDGTVPAGTVIVPGCNPAGTPVPGDRETYENIGTVVVPGDTDEDPSHYCNTPNPGIDIEKLTNGNQADGANDGDVPQLNPGDAITWTYEVTNTGDVPFAQADVTVADSQGLTLVFDPASDDGVDGILSVGEVWVYTAQGVALDLDGTVPAGTVIVPGCNPNGTPVPGDRETYENIGTVTVPGDTDEDPSHYCNPPAPGIDIEKLTNGNQADGANDGDVPQIDVGAPVTWTYEVTNTGDVPFAAADVVVTDSQGLTLVFDPASDDGADGILSVGEVWTYTAQGVALDLDGTVPAGTVIVPGCNPAGGPVPGDRETYENIGTVVVPGDTDEDPSHYCNTPNPGIDIEKLTNGNQADGANDGDVPQLNPGDAITWTYEVTNTGDVPFAQADVTVADSQGLTLVFDPASDDGVDGILSVGEVWVYTAQGVALDLDGTVPAGTVIVPGCNPNGTPVPGDRETYENIGTVTVPGDTDEDPSHYCNPPAPGIDIEKLTNGNQADGANDGDVPQIDVGAPVTWTYEVTNTGDVPFAAADVVVTDSQGLTLVFDPASDDGADGILSVGEVWTYTAQGVALDLDGTVPAGTVIVPGCNPAGGPVPGDRETYENIGTVVVPGDTDEDPSHYCNTPNPGIDIEKTTNGNDADGANDADVPQLAPGDAVTWTYEVTNTGDVPFAQADVTVADSQGLTLTFDPASDDGADGILSVGEVWIYTAQGVALDLDGTVPAGTVIVPGCNPNGTPVPGDRETYQNIGTVTVPGDTDEDPSHYCNPPAPGIDIEKLTNGNQADGANDGDVPQVAPGDLVVWTYLVTNTGDVPFAAADVAVADSQGLTLTFDPASDVGDDLILSPAEQWTYTAQGTASDLDGAVPAGTVIVPGCNPDGTTNPGDRATYENIGTVVVPGDTDEDPSHYCNPPEPGIEIEKRTNGNDADDANGGDVPELAPGDLVTWTYLVTNTGDLPYSEAQVSVTDDQNGVIPVLDPATDVGGDGILSPGETWTYTASAAAPDLSEVDPTEVTIVEGCRRFDGAGNPYMRETYENIGTVSVPGDSDSDPSHWCNTPDPGIEIEKLTNGNHADGPNDADVPRILSGDLVTWTYLVTNTGDVPYAEVDVVVTDDQGVVPVLDPASDVGGDGVLSPGETWTYTADQVAPDLTMVDPMVVTIVDGCETLDSMGVPFTRETYANIGTVAVPGDNDSDPSHWCNTVEDCEISVSKFCDVMEETELDDSENDMAEPSDDCDGKIIAMKLEYTGEGCGATTNYQDGKVYCSGDANGFEPVEIRVTDSRGDLVYADAHAVFLGDVIEVLASNAGEDTLKTETKVKIEWGLETVKFHTSCSQPIAVGDEFGSVRVVELTTTNGGTVTLPEPEDPGPIPENPMDGETDCTAVIGGAGDDCDGKPVRLDFRYIGGDCSQTTQDQDGAFSCGGDAGLSEPVRIVVEDGGTIFLDTGLPANVFLGDVVSATAANAGEDRFGSETKLTIYNAAGREKQWMEIHTSCSKPINVGNVFGAVELFGLQNTGGDLIVMGAQVDYRYVVTNNSAVTAFNVVVLDDKLGEVPGSPIASLEPGESVELFATGLINKDTTNVVTVDAELDSGFTCPTAEASATVTIVEPPRECDGSIQKLTLEYRGPDVPGPTTVRIEAGNFRNHPVYYDFPDGLVSGTVIASPAQNGYTIDASVEGEDKLGSKTYLYINHVEEVIHTSCSAPIVTGQPAPLDDPKGDPSPNWLVVDFAEQP